MAATDERLGPGLRQGLRQQHGIGRGRSHTILLALDHQQRQAETRPEHRRRTAAGNKSHRLQEPVGLRGAQEGEELRHIGLEDNPGEILRALDEAGLLVLFSSALAGGKLNWQGLSKLEKIVRLTPDEPRFRNARLGTFLYAFTEKLGTRDKQAVMKSTELGKAELDRLNKLDALSRKLEQSLRSVRIRKPSQVYFLLAKARPDEILFLLYHSAYKPVQERIRNYFQKYLPTIQEFPPEEWAAAESKAGPRRNAEKVREEVITNLLDRRPRPPSTPSSPMSPPPPVIEAAGIRRVR